MHSAKGQEWEHVSVLNVTDGNFPNEFATGDAAAIEEERRLLYVAMTRAKQSLTLFAPLRFYAVEQHRHGDAHVYGARSRFMSDALLETMDAEFYGQDDARRQRLAPTSDRRLDVAGRLREMW